MITLDIDIMHQLVWLDFSAPAICVTVVEVRREGSRGSTGFLSSFSAWSSFGEAVVFFLRLEMDLSESPRGRNLLTGLKHWFYATA